MKSTFSVKNKYWNQNAIINSFAIFATSKVSMLRMK